MRGFRLVFFILIPFLSFSQSTFEKAEKLYKDEKYALAKPLLLEEMKENATNIKALEYLGDIEAKNKSWDKALGYFRTLKQLNPKEANYFYKYGGCLGMKAKESNKFKALSMIDEIKISFEKAIQVNPNHIEARWALIELYLQLPGIVGGSEKKAQRYAAQLLIISPVDGYLAKGHIAEYFDRYAEAERNYVTAIAVGGSKTTYQKLSNLYKNKMNQPLKAKEVMDRFANKS
jgi:tetratricopeptide (TPR) repeat protein